MISLKVVVGRAGFEPATLRFLHSNVRLVGWVTPTRTANAAYGGRLQHLRLLVAASRLGSSTKLSYRPQINSSGIKLIYMFRGLAIPLRLFTNPKPEGAPNYGESQRGPEDKQQHFNCF